MSRLSPWFLVAVLLEASFLSPRAAHAVYHAGQAAPDFHKTALDGQPYSLHAYRGKVVVLFLLGYN
jgi:cytochrome oxidase Cu insertion factor (SCO1/SenC/PrrC family)